MSQALRIASLLEPPSSSPLIGVERSPDHENVSLILRVAARRLALVPFAAVTLDEIASDAGFEIGSVERLFPTMHAIGSGILDYERESMRAVMAGASATTGGPLDKLVLVFRSVGENLANDIVVRAGVRIAAESRHLFPERRLDPFRTWQSFVTEQLREARTRQLLRTDVDIPESVRAIVAAGMNVKDLIGARYAWPEAPERFEGIMTGILGALTQPPPEPHEVGRRTE